MLIFSVDFQRGTLKFPLHIFQLKNGHFRGIELSWVLDFMQMLEEDISRKVHILFPTWRFKLLCLLCDTSVEFHYELSRTTLYNGIWSGFRGSEFMILCCCCVLSSSYLIFGRLYHFHFWHRNGSAMWYWLHSIL